jgi:hypothetical protein
MLLIVGMAATTVVLAIRRERRAQPAAPPSDTVAPGDPGNSR